MSDRISVPYPNPETPWNLVFATKMTLAALFISAHAFYIISKSKKQK
jgi:PhoPQ-activated pathogenicity-related protein